MNTKAHKLPDKISDLILLAVKDARKVQKDSKYKLDMGDWHMPAIYPGCPKSGNNKCEVCFAGSIIAKTLKANIKEYMMPESYDEDTRHKLINLNWIRAGYISVVANQVGVNPSLLPEIKRIDSMIQNNINKKSARADWRTYERAANRLKKIGI